MFEEAKAFFFASGLLENTSIFRRRWLSPQEKKLGVGERSWRDVSKPIRKINRHDMSGSLSKLGYKSVLLLLLAEKHGSRVAWGETDCQIWSTGVL